MKISIRKLFHLTIILVVGFTIAAGYFYVTEKNRFPIKAVHIEGSFKHVSKAKIQQAIMPYASGNFLTTPVAKIQQALLKMPWIASVSIKRRWPDTLSLEVTEHKPIAYWNDNSLLGDNKKIFTPSKPYNLQRHIPHLSGPGDQATEVWQNYYDFSQQLQKIGLHIKSLQLTERQSWTMLLGNGMKLLLGKNQPLARITRFVTVYNTVFGSRGSEVSKVDLRYPNGMAVKWKNQQQA